MTALAGVWNQSGRPDAGELCRHMLAAQRIYGPDGASLWEDTDVALGRAIFRLLPEDAHDRAPAQSREGRFVLVGDVRLDDRDDLAAAIGIAEGEARLLHDAALLLRAWERWGEGAFDRLYGDYALALWDKAERRLILARDGIGTRPLHYHRGKDFFAFATMPKGLHALPSVPYAPDETRIAEVLALLPEAGGRTFFEGIDRVEPGHVLTVTRHGVASRRHWSPERGSDRKWRAGQCAEALREAFDRAVAARLRGADDRVATHLSGGLDSSTVTSTAAGLLASRGGRVVAFTSVPRRGYAGADPLHRIGDEGPLAAATAALHPNIEHVLVPTTPGTPLDGLDRDFHLFERPLMNLCNQGWVTAINVEARRRGLKVLLTGGAGNLTISYSGLEHLPDLVARGRFLRLARMMHGLVRHGGMRWRGATVAAFGHWIPAPVWQALQRFAGQMVADPALYSSINPARMAALNLVREAEARDLDLTYRSRRDPYAFRLWVLRRVDPGTGYKGTLGGWGVDHRDPTADRRLVELCLTLPDDAWIAGGQPRALLREAFGGRLPAAVLAERRRGYQAVDWHEGLTAGRAELAQEIERLAAVPAALEALDLPKLRALVADWPEEGWHHGDIMAQYRLGLLRGVAAGHFLRKTLRSNA